MHYAAGLPCTMLFCECCLPIAWPKNAKFSGPVIIHRCLPEFFLSKTFCLINTFIGTMKLCVSLSVRCCRNDSLPDTAQMVPAPSSHLSGADICEHQPAKNMSNIKIYILKVLKWSDSWRVIWSSCDILLCQHSSGVNVKMPCVVFSYCPGQTLEDCHHTTDT